jgi:hypothetical protein
MTGAAPTWVVFVLKTRITWLYRELNQSMKPLTSP